MGFIGGNGSGNGLPGPRGATGDSAYQVAVKHGFTGSEREWLASLGRDGATVFTQPTEPEIAEPGDIWIQE